MNTASETPAVLLLHDGAAPSTTDEELSTTRTPEEMAHSFLNNVTAEDVSELLREADELNRHIAADRARAQLARQPRLALSQSIHDVMDPDVQPFGYFEPIDVPEAKPAPVAAPVRLSWVAAWWARICHAITHPYKGQTS